MEFLYAMIFWTFGITFIELDSVEFGAGAFNVSGVTNSIRNDISLIPSVAAERDDAERKRTHRRVLPLDYYTLA